MHSVTEYVACSHRQYAAAAPPERLPPPRLPPPGPGLHRSCAAVCAASSRTSPNSPGIRGARRTADSSSAREFYWRCTLASSASCTAHPALPPFRTLVRQPATRPPSPACRRRKARIRSCTRRPVRLNGLGFSLFLWMGVK
jgi:hypothetical protein